MDWVSNIAQRAENLLETVDRTAAKTAEEIKGNPQAKVFKQAAETAKRLESRERYVPRQRSKLDGTKESSSNSELNSPPQSEDDEVFHSETSANKEVTWTEQQTEAVEMDTSESNWESNTNLSINSEDSGQYKISEHKGRETRKGGDDEKLLGGLKPEGGEDVDIRVTSPKSPASSTTMGPEVEAQHAREVDGYKRSIASLEEEIDKLDGQLINMQNDLDAAQEALLRSQQVAAEREASLKEKLKSREGDESLRETELMDALKDRDGRIADLETELEGLEHQIQELKSTGVDSEAEIQKLHEELEKAKDFQSLRNLSAAQAEKELQQQEERRLQEASQHQEQLVDLQERITELEQSNSELVYALGEAQRQTDEAESMSFAAGAYDSPAHRKGRAPAGSEEAELFEAVEARQAAELLLAEERKRLANAKDELDTVSDLLDKSRKRAEEWEHKYHELVIRHEQESGELKKKLADAQTHRDLESTAALEKRLYTLTEHLSAKQQAIDEISSEKGALAQRLRNLEARFKDQQRTIQSLQSDHSGFDDDADVEAGHSGGLRYRNAVVPMVEGRGLARPRRAAGMRRISRLAAIAKHPQLAKLVDLVDKICYTIGTVLYRQPWARLAFLCYVGLLHLWVFYVIEFHTREIHDKDFIKEVLQGTNGRPTPILPPGMNSASLPPKV